MGSRFLCDGPRHHLLVKNSIFLLHVVVETEGALTVVPEHPS